jgi:hypothetical protein
VTDKVTEIIARSWIECDPNRGPYTKGEGHPDDPINDLPGSALQGKPRWHWFIPRAEAQIEYLKERGIDLRVKETA